MAQPPSPEISTMATDSTAQPPQRTRCPACDHWLMSTASSRCPECGVALLASVAAPEPSARLLPLVLVALSLSAGIGMKRWVLYGTRWSELLDGRLATIPWYFLLLDGLLLLAPALLITALAKQRVIRRLPRTWGVATVIAAALPFVLDLMTTLL